MIFVYIIAAAAILAGLLALLVKIETETIEVNTYNVPIDKPGFDKPVKIVHITDLHMSPWYPPSRFKAVVDYINPLKPDYVLVTGDLTTHFKELIPGSAAALKELQPREASYAVPGNHDYWIDAGYTIKAHEQAGLKFLLNECAPSHNGMPLTFLGVDDPYTGHDDLKGTSKMIPEGHISVLLAHSPDIIEEASKLDIDYIFAGHTHGGQVRIPFVGAMYIPSKFGRKFDKGWFTWGKTQMYVNKGIGSIFPPVRFLCRREIAIINMVPGRGKISLQDKTTIIL
ncbi:MAG: metallophosphoesterase [Firmicutes bacterium]|nr:metallophosphoesterase [Bacillota bacterium]